VVEQLTETYAGFVQERLETARKSQRFNLGLRYEYTSPYYGARQTLKHQLRFQDGPLVTAKNPSDYLVNADPRQHRPRSGLPGRLSRKKIVLRGGYGIFYSAKDNVRAPIFKPCLSIRRN